MNNVRSTLYHGNNCRVDLSLSPSILTKFYYVTNSISSSSSSLSLHGRIFQCYTDCSRRKCSHYPVLHARTKHTELDIHFVCERVISKLLKIQHIPSSIQLANPLTKSLGTSVFQELHIKLKVIALTPL